MPDIYLKLGRYSQMYNIYIPSNVIPAQAGGVLLLHFAKTKFEHYFYRKRYYKHASSAPVGFLVQKQYDSSV